MIFRQLFDQDTYTYTYFIADGLTKEAAIIDPVLSQVDRDVQLIEELGLRVKFLVETHIHADHITGGGLLRRRVGGQYVAGFSTGLTCADLLLKDGETLQFGDLSLTALSTPGHTNGCTSWKMKDRVFTGDTLLIRGCGRTDFQEGSPEKLYKSVHEKLFTLSDKILVYPAHDYKGRTVSTIGEEKHYNSRLGNSKPLSEFSEMMNNLNLPRPKKIDLAVPGNLHCGVE